MRIGDRLTLRIDTELKKRVFEKAALYDLSVSQITNRLLQMWVTNESMLSGKIGAVRLLKEPK